MFFLLELAPESDRASQLMAADKEHGGTQLHLAALKHSEVMARVLLELAPESDRAALPRAADKYGEEAAADC